ncbi:MAG: ribonuclease HI [Nitrospinaceae bacterium]|nr:ribonuclease HI [Nitrospinaceae bacterium]NIR56835.1 ribonuclease HI [Nitrospinaceae bacterium]NIS87302.1 ribonuclease HI [Nitrospinaceae bacterium]NIT84155.1 ribonuclease HI [Nitrospinaceae bacterium]NIU46342.1 ribonuclease HI [Nitrospinaceae bacterium]
MEKVEIFTDGACRGNPGPGGYGCLIVKNGKTTELKGGNKHTTNNIMEMTAAIVALQQLKEPSEVELTTDSQYVVKGMTEWMDGWIRKNWVNSSKQPVKNKDLWLELKRLNERHKIQWIWVRGHNGHPENERADALANQAIEEMY